MGDMPGLAAPTIVANALFPPRHPLPGSLVTDVGPPIRP